MPKAIVDPAELRRFAQHLKHFHGELQQQIFALRGQFAGLSDTWRDQEHDKFAQRFTETVQTLARFIEAAQQHIPFLLRKAERIDEYLQQR
jgi:WXG100 family type VII secretion target